MNTLGDILNYHSLALSANPPPSLTFLTLPLLFLVLAYAAAITFFTPAPLSQVLTEAFPLTFTIFTRVPLLLVLADAMAAACASMRFYALLEEKRFYALLAHHVQALLEALLFNSFD